MTKDVYTFLKDMIPREIPDIKDVKLWNNQTERGLDWTSITPCVFVEFKPLEYSQTGAGGQIPSDMRILLHLVIWKFLEDDLRAFDLSQLLYVAMKDNGFNRLSEIPDVSYTDLIDFVVEFTVPGYIDKAADELRNFESITKPPINMDFKSITDPDDGPIYDPADIPN
jgi:hypothetical protein